MLIAECYDSDEILVELYGNETHEGIPPFNYRFITSVQNTSTAEHIRNVLEDWLDILPNNASTNWVVRNNAATVNAYFLFDLKKNIFLS